MKIGIDIGGSHVGIGLVDEFGNIQQKKEKYIVEKIENESQINKQNLKEEITQFIIQTIKEYQKMPFLELSTKPVFVENDANCAAWAEHEIGA